MNHTTKRVLLALTLIASIFSLASPASATDSERAPQEERKVTLCHATHSEGNPFVVVTIAPQAVLNSAHVDHQDNEDIIPPFGNFPGLNWTAENQAIHANGCVVPPVVVDPPPFDGPRTCSGDIVLDFNYRFVNGQTAATATVAARVAAGVYDLEFTTYDGYQGRAPTDPNSQTSERVEVLGFTSADLEDSVREAWGFGSGRVTIANDLSEVTATHVHAGGPDSVIIQTVCLTEVIEEPTFERSIECIEGRDGFFNRITVVFNAPDSPNAEYAVRNNGSTVGRGDADGSVDTFDLPPSHGSYQINYTMDSTVVSADSGGWDSGPFTQHTLPGVQCEAPEVPAPVITYECLNADQVTVTVTFPEGDYSSIAVALNGSAIEVRRAGIFGGEVSSDPFTFVANEGDEVLTASVLAGIGAPAASSELTIPADACADDNEPVPANVTFECVGPDAVAYNVTSDAYGLSVQINGQDADLSGVVAPGTVLTVTTFTLSQYSDELITLVTEVKAPRCKPEIEIAPPSIEFECINETTVRYQANPASDFESLTVYVNGFPVAGWDGMVAPGDIVSAVSSANGVYSEVTAEVDAVAPECKPEVEPVVNISTVCNDDLVRTYTVTAGEDTRLTSITVNGDAANKSGIISTGDVLRVVAERNGIYVDQVETVESYTGTDCELSYTGVGTWLIAGAGALLIAAGGLLLVARGRRDPIER